MATPEEQREYQRRWVAKRRADYFADKKCVRCGSTDDLELDHIDPRQKVSHSIWSWSASRRETELAKCQVLCEQCHKEKTLDDMPITQGFVPHQHGTSKEYHRGCRCNLCRASNTEDKRRWRLRQRLAKQRAIEAHEDERSHGKAEADEFESLR